MCGWSWGRCICSTSFQTLKTGPKGLPASAKSQPLPRRFTVVVDLCTTEDAMHARVWQLHIRPGRVQDFQDVFSSVVDLARRQEGYRGVLSLASGKSESQDVTVGALWDSLQALRAI